MEKSTYDKEAEQLFKEATKLAEKSQLDLETIEFLNDEGIKLEDIINSENSTQAEIDKATLQFEILCNKIASELIEADAHEIKANKLEKQLKKLKRNRVL